MEHTCACADMQSYVNIRCHLETFSGVVYELRGQNSTTCFFSEPLGTFHPIYENYPYKFPETAQNNSLAAFSELINFLKIL